MPGIDPCFICHSLKIESSVKPIRQKQRKFSSEMHDVTDEELGRLLKVGFIQEVDCSDWLSNIVLVKKNNKK